MVFDGLGGRYGSQVMIDTGCQVTISDRQVRSRLHPFGLWIGFGRFVPVDCEGRTGVERSFFRD